MSLSRIAVLWFQSRILRSQAARWNYQYATGKWDKLKQESARLSSTASLLIRHVPPGHILEIGCGEALLQQQLKAVDYHSWVGVDLSEVAIRRAQTLAGKNSRYLLADMETLEPEGQFDAIVFTESIYYSADCAQLLRRYSTFLNPSGVFIISIYRTKRSAGIWNEIHSVATAFDLATTTNEIGTWDCEALRPRPRASTV